MGQTHKKQGSSIQSNRRAVDSQCCQDPGKLISVGLMTVQLGQSVATKVTAIAAKKYWIQKCQWRGEYLKVVLYH